MFNFTVKILEKGRLVDAPFQKLVQNKKVIVCPSIKFGEKITLGYFEYLDSLLDRYVLDDIIILNSSQDNFFHMFVQSYFPRFTTVSDANNMYVSSLKRIKQNKLPIDELKKKWIFQHLLIDGKENGFWEQPLSDHWKHLIDNKRAMKVLMSEPSFRKAMQENYKNRNRINLWEIPTYLLLDYGVKDSLVWDFFFRKGSVFFYFNLYGNKSLESVLDPINTSVGNMSRN